MSEYHDKRAKEILTNIIYATVATVTPDGLPWNSPVRHNIDEQLSIYWASDQQNQHSINIRHNGRVFIVIYDSSVPEGQGEGVYIEADAVELEDPEEIIRYRKLKKGDGEYDANEFTGRAIRRVYKAVPKRAWMNTVEIKNGVFIRDYKVEISIKDLLQ